MRLTKNKVKVIVAMMIGIVLGSFGNIALSRGMRCVGTTGYDCARAAISGAVTHPYIIVGILLMICFLLLYLASLSWEDLTYVMPFTAGDYVLVTVLAYFILQEPVGPTRWAGSILVAFGIYLVARS